MDDIMMMMMMMINATGTEQVIVNLRRELPPTNSFDAVAAETKLVRAHSLIISLLHRIVSCHTYHVISCVNYSICVFIGVPICFYSMSCHVLFCHVMSSLVMSCHVTM